MDIVIIGGIAAGMSAAAKAKRVSKDSNVIVYEKGDILSFGACGLPYYVGDFFSDTNKMIARTPEEFRESGIEINIKHEVLKIDDKNKELEIKNLNTGEIFKKSFDKLMIATGATSVTPPIEKINDFENVFTLKSLEDGINLKKAMEDNKNKEVVIVGGGYIGIEVVEAAKKHNKNVRVIQLDHRIMTKTFDKEITDIMEEEMKNHDIKINLNETVKKLHGDKKVKKVITDKGEYEAHIVVIATGVKPNTGFLKGTNIKLEKGAIVIDSYGKTSVEDIYSAGDCAVVYHKIRKKNVYIPLATTANKIGRLIGENLTGKNIEFKGTLGSACVKVMDLEAGRTGITEKEAKMDKIAFKTKLIKDKNQTGYYPGQEDIFIKLIYHANSKIILGGQIIGKKGAVLRTDVLAMAIETKMTTDQLGMMDFCYSPPFTKTWDPLNIAGNVSK